MRILKITDEIRNDFWAVYECEHCGAKEKGTGYHDMNFHKNVIPKKPCAKCKKTGEEAAA